MVKKKGIDISYWQGSVNFSKVKKDGVKFVILREGYRKSIDGKFLEYVKGCRKEGIPILGVYHFIYALNVEQARQEAISCINNIKKAGLGKDVIVFCDLEYDSVKKAKEKGVIIDKSKCIAFTKAFCETVTKSGYKAGIYSNMDYYKNMYSKELIDKYIFWLAEWTSREKPSLDCTIWQYSDKGKINGINGNVDMNLFFSDIKDTKPVVEKSAHAVLNVAKSWIGYNESDGSHRKIIDVYNSHKPLARGYKMSYADPWCAAFVSSCAIKAGVTNILPTECECNNMIELFKKLGEWVENDAYVPKTGDVIFYDWEDSGYGDNTGSANHVGIVETCDGKTIIVIEGNISNTVGRRNIPVNGKYIRGYGVPKFTSIASSLSSSNKTIDELANEVIRGLWGSGDERKKRLTAAGYDYNAIQKRVNEILSGNTTSSSKKTIDELANEVIQGLWGSGDERKKRLTAAGYDYNAVQKRVNELLS
ncbi:GH25 family lysozyme [Methanobrevibacter sp.]